jgi:hypothetical protein
VYFLHNGLLSQTKPHLLCLKSVSIPIIRLHGSLNHRRSIQWDMPYHLVEAYQRHRLYRGISIGSSGMMGTANILHQCLLIRIKSIHNGREIILDYKSFVLQT